MSRRTTIIRTSTTAPSVDENGADFANVKHFGETLTVHHLPDGGVALYMLPDPYEPDFSDLRTLGWFQTLDAAQLAELQGALEP